MSASSFITPAAYQKAAQMNYNNNDFNGYHKNETQNTCVVSIKKVELDCFKFMKPTARFAVGLGNIKTSVINTVRFTPQTNLINNTWRMTYRNQRRSKLTLSVLKRHTFRSDRVVAKTSIHLSNLIPNHSSELIVDLLDSYGQVVGNAIVNVHLREGQLWSPMSDLN